jgi:hypothetical protein
MRRCPEDGHYEYHRSVRQRIQKRAVSSLEGPEACHAQLEVERPVTGEVDVPRFRPASHPFLHSSSYSNPYHRAYVHLLLQSPAILFERSESIPVDNYSDIRWLKLLDFTRAGGKNGGRRSTA